MNTLHKKRKNFGVSEIVATMLLLIIAISALALIYSYVLSDDGPPSTTIVKIVGRAEGKYVILEHMGGENIDLDAKITYSIAGNSYTKIIGEIIEQDKEPFDVWNLGERLKIDITEVEADLSRILDSLDELQLAEITGVDAKSNSIVFQGPISLPELVSDVGVSISVDNNNPNIGETVEITLTITSYGGDINGSGSVKVKYLLPEGLQFNWYDTTHGDYDLSTGMWDAGHVLVGEPAVLTINCEVLGIEIRESVQLAMLLDGSGSIIGDDWDVMIDGLSNAIEDSDIIPHDGSVELTIIQFGGSSSPTGRTWAQVELKELGGPIIIDETNFENVANKIKDIDQLGGGTPISCAFRLSADVLSGDPNSYLEGTSEEGMASDLTDCQRRVIILVTDGMPNIIYDHDDRYGGWWAGLVNGWDWDNQYAYGKLDSEDAREYLLETLDMKESDDELNVIAVWEDYIDIDWLNTSIAWPEPGYIAPPFDQGSGWVSEVFSWEEFVERLEETFRQLFYGITNTVEYQSSTTYDPNTANHIGSVTITPN